MRKSDVQPDFALEDIGEITAVLDAFSDH